MADDFCAVCEVLDEISLESEFCADDFVNICIKSLLSISGTPNKETCKKHPPIIQWLDVINLYELLEKINALTCGGCEKETKVTKTYCFKCKGVLCQDCESVHEKLCMREHHQHTWKWNVDVNLKYICERLVSPYCSVCPDNDCIVLCKGCDYTGICQACVDGEHHDHNIQSVNLAVQMSKKKLSKKIMAAKENIDKIDGLYNAINEHIRTLRKRHQGVANAPPWDSLTEELNAQGEESKVNIENKVDPLKLDLKILNYLFDSLTSWTYWHFSKDMEKKVDDLIIRSRTGGIKCEGNLPKKPGPKCQTCGIINETNFIQGRIGCVEILESFNCQSQNVVYVITCNQCNLQYVGETSEGKGKVPRCLRDRVNEHLSKIRKQKAQKGDQYFHKHFIEGECKDVDVTVTVVRQIENNEKRRAVETALMLKLGTVHIGENERLKRLPISPLCDGFNIKCSPQQALDQQLFKLNEYLFLGQTKAMEEKTKTNLEE